VKRRVAVSVSWVVEVESPGAVSAFVMAMESVDAVLAGDGDEDMTIRTELLPVSS